MPDLLNIGLTALLSQQRALSTTSNNIANASTPGYSRQRVEFAERPPEDIGREFIGRGVEIADIRRLTDEAATLQLRSAASGSGRAGAFVELAEVVNSLVADTESGLPATLQSFVNSLHDVANDPLSTSSRQSLLSEARSLAARFGAMDRRMAEVSAEVRTRMTEATARISDLGAQIAAVNREITSFDQSGGQSAPSDLLDQRDRLLDELASLVSVDTAVQRDGALNVYIGTGQVLVLGGAAATLAMSSGNVDPEQPQIVIRGIGPDVNVTQFLSGGKLGGAIDFYREVLAPARSELGRITVGLASVVNTAHRAGMDAEGQLGGDFFAVAGPQAFSAAANAGTGAVAVTITNVAALEPTNYSLLFNGASYSLQRTDNGAVVPLTGAGTVASPFVANGISIVVSGTPAAGDQFLLKPVEQAGGTLRALVVRAADVAAAAPTRTSAALANVGTGTISAGTVVDAANPNLLTTATLQFLTPTTYSINGAGSFAYTPGADIDVNGTRVQIVGAPAVGDQFVIEANFGGVGDNRAVQTMIARLGQSVFSGAISLQDAAAGLVTSVGARTAEAGNESEVQSFMLNQGRDRLESVRGVNLDEEAANMLRHQQLYEAAAQTMAVARTLFDTLLLVLR